MSDREGNKDLTREAKKGHGYRKVSFMRRYNAFQNLTKTEVQGTLLKEAYKVMAQVYEALDECH